MGVVLMCIGTTPFAFRNPVLPDAKGRAVMKEEQLSIRIRPANSNHHLWLNNGTWYTHYTLHSTDFTKRRVRVSLGTHDIEKARAARDRVLGKYAGDRRFIGLQTAGSCETTGSKETQ
jgi:hypothetical protein